MRIHVSLPNVYLITFRPLMHQ